MNRISISIITITYNNLDGLKKTIESIDRNFKLFNNYINHVIIDGNSIDGTSNYIFNILTNRKIKTTYISEPDMGIYDAMNKGVTNSFSDFVIFINSGDLLLTDFFEKPIYLRLFTILDNPVFAGLALSCVYDFNGEKYIVNAREINISTPKMPSLHQGIIYKRSVLNEIPYSLKYKICGDWENISKIINKYKFDVMKANVSELNAGGISTKKPFSLISESYYIYKTNFSANLTQKIFYIIKLFISLLGVQILYLKSKLKKIIVSRF